VVIPNFGAYLTNMSQIFMCSGAAKWQSNMCYTSNAYQQNTEQMSAQWLVINKTTDTSNSQLQHELT